MVKLHKVRPPLVRHLLRNRLLGNMISMPCNTCCQLLGIDNYGEKWKTKKNQPHFFVNPTMTLSRAGFSVGQNIITLLTADNLYREIPRNTKARRNAIGLTIVQ